MSVAEETRAESRVFEADVAKLLHLMVHSVYSDKAVFLRELISNAADAYEKLRYDAIANPALLGDDPKPRITLAIDPEHSTLTVEDNGIGWAATKWSKRSAPSPVPAPRPSWSGSRRPKAAPRRKRHRPVRHRILLGVHGGGPRRRVLPPRRNR
jgi:hypothetical protein